MKNKILFFDIETTANQKAIDLLPEPIAQSNYKDPEKINQYVNEKKLERVTQAALDADLGQIKAISWCIGMDGEINTLLVNDETIHKDTWLHFKLTEKDLIWSFWSQYNECNGQSCGYNIAGFDLPFILRRSLDLKIPVQIRPNLAKYRIEPTIDLMGILYNWGPAKGLKFVCKRYGIKNPLPDLDGSQVINMDNDTLRKYVANDVNLVRELYKRMLGIYLPIEP